MQFHDSNCYGITLCVSRDLFTSITANYGKPLPWLKIQVFACTPVVKQLKDVLEYATDF